MLTSSFTRLLAGFTLIATLHAADDATKPKPKDKPKKQAAVGPAIGENKATPISRIKVAKDFKVELLYTVPKAEQGSWVSMTVDKKGRLICGDQNGKLFRLTPPAIGSGGKSVVEPIDAEIGGAHGLLYAYST